MPKKQLTGIIVSDKPDKTVVVKVQTLKTHPKYKRRFRSHKKYHAHDENNEYSTGETVMIEESAPTSKKKAWKVIKKISYDTTANKT